MINYEIYNHLTLVIFSLFLFSSCTVTEVAQKTKNTFTSGAGYLKDKSIKAYGASKRALGIENSKKNPAKPMSVSKRKFDVLSDGTQVNLFVLTNANGMQVSLLDYGGTVKDIRVPDRDGKLKNVSLGFSNIKDYVEKSPYFGCITGRYANRIAKGKFSLGGKIIRSLPTMPQIIYMVAIKVLISSFGMPKSRSSVRESFSRGKVLMGRKVILGILIAK